MSQPRIQSTVVGGPVTPATIPDERIGAWMGQLTRLADDVQIGLCARAVESALRGLVTEIRDARKGGPR